MNNREISLINIHSYLVEFTQHVHQLNTSSFFNFNKIAETIAINLLHSIYGYNLVNANDILSANFPAIDLVDEEKGIVIQVTSDSSNEKVLYTIEKFISKNLNLKYKALYIYTLTNKPNYYKPTREKITSLLGSSFNVNHNIIDNPNLGKVISNITSLEKILKIEQILQSEFGSKKLELTKPITNSNPKFKLDYRNRLTKFSGREDELKQLSLFYQSESSFSWWIVTGKAGSGKSRIALEFGYQIQSLGGEWGFISFDQIDSFDLNNTYPRPLLLIIDYAQSDNTKVIKLIKMLSNKTGYGNKIRLLLIERVANGEWWKSLINNFYSSSSLYNEKPLELNKLNTDILINIIEEIIAGEKVDIKIEKEVIIKKLIDIDSLQRPLFAMLAGFALAKNQSIYKWNQYDLLDFIINDNLKHTKEAFKEHDDIIINKHKDLLALATVCYGLTGYDIEKLFKKNIDWLPNKSDFDNELYDFLSLGSILEKTNKWIPEFSISRSDALKGEIEIHPLMPDILGEYFVLNNLQTNSRFKYRDVGKIENFIETAEEGNFYYYNIFLRRILQDFPSHDKVINFLIGNKDSYIDNRGSSGFILLESMKYLYYNNLDYLKILWGYTKILSETVNRRTNQKGLLDDPDRVYQEACQIMIYKNTNDYDEQEKYYKIMVENTNKFELNPQVFIDSSSPLGEEFDFDEARELYTRMEDPEYAKEYLSKRTVTDQRIPHLEVLAINCILLMRTMKNQDESSNKYFERLFYLCKKFTYPRIKVDTIITCIEYGVTSIANFDTKIDELFTEILLTPPQVGVINVQYEQYEFVRKLLEYKISVRDSYGALTYFTKFKSYLLSLKPNANIGNILIELSLTAYYFTKQFYESNILITGDLFYKEVMYIDQKLNIPPHIFNPIKEKIAKLDKYRNGYFD